MDPSLFLWRKHKLLVGIYPHTNWLNGMLKGKLVWGLTHTATYAHYIPHKSRVRRI